MRAFAAMAQTPRYLLGVCLVVLVLSFSATVLFYRLPPTAVSPSHYQYIRLKAANGVLLHTIRTRPGDVTPEAIDSNVTQTGKYGINGGFFWEGALLSIAAINDKPLKGEPGDYGSGWYNIDNAKGTLVWDGHFSVQVAEAVDELNVMDKNRYWAQGGISMRLGDDSGWYAQAALEGLPAMEEKRMRSGAAYDRNEQLWLFVSPTPCTGEQFRSAVKEKIAAGKLVDGIFLDGDGSSQLRVREAALTGDGRQVYQMLTIRR